MGKLIKRLLPLILVLAFVVSLSSQNTVYTVFAAPATALEVYGAHTETEASHTGDTNYVQYLRVTVDRSGEAGTKNFFIIAHIGLQVGHTYAYPVVKLEQDDTTVIGEVDGLIYGSTQVAAFNHGFTYNFVRRVSLDNTSHTFDLDYKTSDSAHTVYAETASIVVIEESANAEYTEQIAEVCSTSNDTLTDLVTLTFTLLELPCILNVPLFIRRNHF